MRDSEFVYGVLLGAYPEEFRDAHGQELEQAFADLYREESSAAVWSRSREIVGSGAP